MRLSRITIQNFRNFRELNVPLGKSSVIMGENRVGKSNLLYALRLVLDPTLSDANRQLDINDFWDGLKRPLSDSDKISIKVQLADFEEEDDLLAVLADHLVEPEPMIAELCYEFTKLSSESDSENENKYDFICYGGGRQENYFGYEVRKRIPIEVLHALRDVEGDLSTWRRSPLRPLSERIKKEISKDTIETVASEVSEASDKISNLNEIALLAENLNAELSTMAGSAQALKTSFGLSPLDPDKLLKSLRLFIDDGIRDVSEASLGSANVLYLALRSLELKHLAEEGSRQHTFYAIEEPEAHLHPQLQRMVYRTYLRERNAQDSQSANNPVNYLLTTHSPHIASVAPVNSFVLLRKTEDGSTIGVSAVDVDLSNEEKDDIERYLDVTRAEALFSKGIIFVEGDAERYLIPLLAKRAGFDLDALGITLCSVSGTNFVPYVKFFGPKGLNLPMVILTDLDPYKTEDGTKANRSETRVENILEALGETFYFSNEDKGVFVNNYTFEIDLYQKGGIYPMNDTIQDLCPVEAAKSRFAELAIQAMNNGKTIVPLSDPKRFLKDIEYVGKGRFAQRLAWHISQWSEDFQFCPDYILKGINYLIEKINGK